MRGVCGQKLSGGYGTREGTYAGTDPKSPVLVLGADTCRTAGGRTGGKLKAQSPSPPSPPSPETCRDGDTASAKEADTVRRRSLGRS